MSSRRAVPDAARRSLWLAAAWTGVGAAVVCATLAVVAVAICWLPVSGASAHPLSALRAGLLTYLAALHGGITVDGSAAAFLPLGLTVIVGYAAWRAGAALADAADALDETDPVRLVQAGGVQAGAFAAASLIAIPFAQLGTSSAPFLGVLLAAPLLFAVTGGVSFARSSALAEWCLVRVPARIVGGTRAATAALVVLLGMGAVLVAASLVLHAGRVETLSRQVGGGWGGVPILVLGALSAPNAVIAGATYLAGPGFALGSGTHVGPTGSGHGLLPAFPVLGAVPDGPATTPVWLLIALTPLLAGAVAARQCRRARRWPQRFQEVGVAAAVAAVAMAVLAWQGGGGIGSGRLAVIGASPWLAGLVVAAEIGAAAAGCLGLLAARDALRARRRRPVVRAVAAAAHDAQHSGEAESEGAGSVGAPQLVVVADEPAAAPPSGGADADEGADDAEGAGGADADGADADGAGKLAG